MDEEVPQPYKHPKPLYEYPGNEAAKTPPAPAPKTPKQEAIPQPSYQPKKIGKWKASGMLIKQSFNLLKKDKEVMLFPVLASISMMVILVLIVLASIFIFDFNETLDGGDSQSLSPTWYGYLFVMYIISVFIASYFQAGLVTIVYGRIKGEDKSFSDGIENANKHIGKIFAWSVLSATVGVVLQFLADRSKWLGKLVIYLVGVAWSIVTLFIVPTLIFENLSVKDSVKRSAQVFKQVWGETAILNFSAGMIFGIIMFLIIGASAILLVITGQILVFLILPFILCMFIGVLSSTLNGIFNIVLYHFATTGTVAEGFNKDLVMGAVKKK